MPATHALFLVLTTDAETGMGGIAPFRRNCELDASSVGPDLVRVPPNSLSFECYTTDASRVKQPEDLDGVAQFHG